MAGFSLAARGAIERWGTWHGVMVVANVAFIAAIIVRPSWELVAGYGVVAAGQAAKAYMDLQQAAGEAWMECERRKAEADGRKFTSAEEARISSLEREVRALAQASSLRSGFK